MRQILLPEESLASLCALLCESTQGRCGVTPQGAQSFFTPASVWYSRTQLSGLDGDAVREVLAGVKQQAGPRPSLVSFTAEAADEHIPALLEDAGFTPMAKQAGMVYTLSGQQCETGPGDAVVEQVKPADIAEWSAAGAQAFQKPDEAAAFAALVNSGECIFYGVRQGGKLVATLLLHLDPNNAGIHEVSVSPECRGRGFAKQLTQTALATLAARNIPLVSLQSSEMGEKVYGGLGFVRVSTLETWMYIKQP